ncbi:DnaJ domain-containing protein [Desulfopila aestuarii]|uniref:DnaJ domain-containing protein n=1 Tax=Desulfopila aestuarii DSM 18488 TaxID=1121416 RepID=A0A1M7XYB7_9BACT|nr:DnaJ domain-containing protein [Desulfopila aestuarii]SHO44004.1 DnaJ domain-containing protein [Desulfopila aestuarii DSM 18488]
MPKNYYIILGIPFTSSQEDIKAAFRRLAKEYHPDHYGENQTPFQAIHEAYSVLSDPASRRTYDSHLQDRVEVHRQPKPAYTEPGSGESVVEPLIPEVNRDGYPNRFLDRSIHGYNSLFDGLFDRLLSGFEEDRHPRFTHNSTIEVQLTREQARQGGNVRLKVPMQIRCPSCNCFGHKGVAGCWRCNGTGYLTGEKQLLISFPAGVASGHIIQLPVTRVDDRDLQLSAIIKIYERR